ncbi:hypothetical protein [Shimia sagamensis]|uniref:Uncharacterized protein n=1 Tax=Shimia sagamensis TaxID=1566352 RepID=A0ABY1PKY0_9RHOB|nr:hypothetical protein [Shimia sagamensis]SMP34751.1 hypothetical protein SAMN06265373_11089 [Shimia sagamensis]
MYPLLADMSVTTSSVADDQVAAVTVQVDELARNPEAAHGAVYALEESTSTEWGFYEQNIVSLAFLTPPHKTLLAFGEWGDAWLFDGGPGGTHETFTVPRGPMRGVRAVGSQGDAFACGADTQVFHRSPTGEWRDISPSADLREDNPQGHLEAIDGYGSDELYAAGRAGVIWWFDGVDWTAVQCPTNLSFYAIHCGRDGKVYAAGQAGILAIGRYGAFELFTPPDPLNDIWGVATWQGTVYLAGFRALLTWDGEAFDTVADAMDLAKTFYDLHVSDRALWSFGMKDALRFDGKDWTRVDTVTVR